MLTRTNRKIDGAWQKIRRGSAILLGASERRRSKAASRRFLSKAESKFSELRMNEGGEPVVQQSLHERLNEKLFLGELDEKKYADIIRTSHLLTVENCVGNQPPQRVQTSSAVTEADFPDKQKRDMQRMIVVMEQLINYFANDKEAEPIEEMVEFLYDFSEMYSRELITKREFNLNNLFEELSKRFEDEEQIQIIESTRTMLKFLHVNVIIFAIEEIRAKLKLGLKHLTKDMTGGWEIKLKLDERTVEISHTRRESALQKINDDNDWEIEYNVTMIFDQKMAKFTASRLSLTNLHLPATMNSELADELKTTFFGGKFIIC